MLATVEQSRRRLSKAIDPKQKSLLGQFFTPANIARFMAGLFVDRGDGNCRLLDAGAGIGSLSAAFLDRWACGDFHFRRVAIDAFEIDDSLHPYLTGTLEGYKPELNVVSTIRKADFVAVAADWIAGNLFAEPPPPNTPTSF